MPSTRRQFILGTTAAAGALLASSLARGQPAPAAPAPLRLPRRRGFNLTALVGGQRGQSYPESDFQWMAEWGFDFARLPLSYWAWSSPRDWLAIDPKALEPLDQAIEFGRRHGIHLNLNLHRIPGYCVNGREAEPFQLFDSPPESMRRALAAAVHHWRFLAERYRDIPNERLSFDLLNEPPFMADQSRYVEIARALIAAIRSVSPERLIVADGADLGQTPVAGLIDEGIAQSTRGYLPKMVSHYTATWVPQREFESFARPTWPMTDSHGTVWNRAELRRRLIDPWRPLVERGVPIHVGEWGCYNRTPHVACLAWMSDLLGLWKEAGWGWSMWNLRGDFGILDSGRSDVAYENFRGHQ
ncbi:MAG TPA: cellulase family glycosylhydrolase, partial [Opitutaceae bacterium]|nr:cellulase family glycosylhydrolase [Opitutaceae bacterium]